MIPSYFGPEGEQLLGLHHPPTGPSRNMGVVLCSPAPQEALRSHWAFRKLAELLAKAGFDVLRFDYRGTGDSAGELSDCPPQLWVEDIRRAARELKDISGVRKVSAVGFRMGAVLLAQAAASGLSLDTLVMWEPIVSMAKWIEGLALIEKQQRRELIDPPLRLPGELMGFVVSTAILNQWKTLDLTLVSQWDAGRTVVVASGSPELERLRQSLSATGQSTTWSEAGPPGAGLQQGVLLGNEALHHIVAALGERR